MFVLLMVHASSSSGTSFPFSKPVGLPFLSQMTLHPLGTAKVACRKECKPIEALWQEKSMTDGHTIPPDPSQNGNGVKTIDMLLQKGAISSEDAVLALLLGG